MMNPEYRLCTVEERRLLDDVHEAMADRPHPDFDRMMAIVDTERDVINAAVTLILPGPGSWFELAVVVHHLLNLRAKAAMPAPLTAKTPL